MDYDPYDPHFPERNNYPLVFAFYDSQLLQRLKGGRESIKQLLDQYFDIAAILHDNGIHIDGYKYNFWKPFTALMCLFEEIPRFINIIDGRFPCIFVNKFHWYTQNTLAEMVNTYNDVFDYMRACLPDLLELYNQCKQHSPGILTRIFDEQKWKEERRLYVYYVHQLSNACRGFLVDFFPKFSRYNDLNLILRKFVLENIKDYWIPNDFSKLLEFDINSEPTTFIPKPVSSDITKSQSFQKVLLETY